MESSKRRSIFVIANISSQMFYIGILNLTSLLIFEIIILLHVLSFSVNIIMYGATFVEAKLIST